MIATSSPYDRRWIALVAIAVIMSACAIQDPPPGGPEDRKPPRVMETIPANDSAGVSPDADILLVFDEGMKRDRLERQIRFYPPILIDKAAWRGDALLIRPEGLHPDTTYVVELAPGYSDAHNVKNLEPYRFAFATSAAIDSGAVSGRVFFRRKLSDKAVVNLFRLPQDSAFAPEAARPDRQHGVGPNGGYRHSRLPTRDARFVLWAFQDANGNGRFDAASEFGQVVRDTIALSPERPERREVDIYITDPTEPGEVKGVVVNRTGVDSLPIALLLEAINDTSITTYYTRADLDGNYRFNPLRGDYLLRAFMDFNPDSLCGNYPCPGDSNSACPEPCALYPDTVHIDPGDKLLLEDLTLEAVGGG